MRFAFLVPVLLLAGCNDNQPVVAKPESSPIAEAPDPYAGMTPAQRVSAICEKEYRPQSSEAIDCKLKLWKRYTAEQEQSKLDKLYKQVR